MKIPGKTQLFWVTFKTFYRLIILVTMTKPISSHVKDKKKVSSLCVIKIWFFSKRKNPGISSVSIIKYNCILVILLCGPRKYSFLPGLRKVFHLKAPIPLEFPLINSFILSLINFGWWDPPPPWKYQWSTMGRVWKFSETRHCYLRAVQSYDAKDPICNNNQWSLKRN